LLRLGFMEKVAPIKGQCWQCGEKLKGRSDKRFCDVECKNNYHNENSTEAEETLKRIVKILKENRNILKDVLGKELSVNTTRAKLESKGYEMDYLTHIKEIGSKKKKYHYVLDYGYRVEDDGTLTVVRAFH